jgi:hypothetical protein
MLVSRTTGWKEIDELYENTERLEKQLEELNRISDKLLSAESVEEMGPTLSQLEKLKKELQIA